jgi:orotate phosphoribosyltransferase
MDEESLIKALKSCEAIQYGKFVLTSGAISKYYVDIKKASTHPQTLQLIATLMKEYTADCDLIAGMELGAVPLIVALSLNTNIPFVIIRKTKKEHGTEKLIEGRSVKNKNVLIVEDVTTSGKSVIKTIDIIREQQGKIKQVISIVDRECGAKELLERNNVIFTPLLSISRILDK